MKERRTGVERLVRRWPLLPLCLLAVTGLALHFGPPTLGRLIGDGMGQDPTYRQWRALHALADQSAREARDSSLPAERARLLGSRQPAILDLWGQPISIRVTEDPSGVPVLLLMSAGPDRHLQTDPEQLTPRSDDILVWRR